MKVKVEKLMEMSDQIDDIFHKNGFIVDHDVLTLHILNIIKSSYPQDNVKLENPDLDPLSQKYG